MAKRKYEFEENDWDDVREYKKNSKKKMKPREESSSKSWRYNANHNYSDDYGYDDEENHRY